jgi:hypothetical protein
VTIDGATNADVSQAMWFVLHPAAPIRARVPTYQVTRFTLLNEDGIVGREKEPQMSTSMPTFRLTRRLVFALTALALVATFLVSASPVGAFHCYVGDKPQGAGAVAEGDIKDAGKSGKQVAPGAFLDGSEIGLDVDVFIRGKPVGEEEVVGIGTLPEQPHVNGSADHGVLELEFEEE